MLYKSSGCDQCHQMGYKGRIGIFQLLTMTPNLRSLIIQHPSFDAIGEQASKDGMKTLLDDGLEKVKAGLISLAELLRVIG